MFDWLAEAVAPGPQVTIDETAARLVLAFVLGGVVAGIYKLTQRGELPGAPNLALTLVMLAILMAIVTQVVGNNPARAFGFAGALSIVRFRTVVEDTRDTAFVVFAVVVGMAVGAGHPLEALVGIAVAGTAAAFVRPASSAANDQWSLNVRVAAGKAPEAPLEELFRKHLNDVRLMSTTTSRQGSALDLTYRVRLRPPTSATTFAADLNLLAGLQNVELRRL